MSPIPQRNQIRSTREARSSEDDREEDVEDDNERARLHRRCEVKKRGDPWRVVCQCRPPVTQDATGRGEEDENRCSRSGDESREGRLERPRELSRGGKGG